MTVIKVSDSTFDYGPILDIPLPLNELSYVDEDIAARFKGQMLQWMQGMPTQMQLIKELRLLREALAKSQSID